MEEVQQETVNAASGVYDTYVEQGLAETPAFKGVGMQYFLFAKNELTEDEVDKLLTEVFTGILIKLNSEKNKMKNYEVEK